MPDMQSPVDVSIAAFEQAHDLTVTVHDCDGRLAGLVDPVRTRHRHSLCTAVKSGPDAHHCYRFEVTELRKT